MMQKFVKYVKGKDNKKYKAVCYKKGSIHRNYNKRRLKKQHSLKYTMHYMKEDKDFPPDDISKNLSVELGRHATKHTNQIKASNVIYDDWKTNPKDVPMTLDNYSNSTDWDKIDKLDNTQNDKVANSWINAYDDMLPDYVDKVIINPTIRTVSQFINYMFAHYNTVVHITNAKGNKLKYWHLTELNGKHHCPDENVRWFSEARELRCGYTAQNIIWGIHHNSLKKIQLSQDWVPPVNKNVKTIFVLWGMIGANEHKAQKYLRDKYNVNILTNSDSYKKVINYINRFIKKDKLASKLTTRNNFVSIVGMVSWAKALFNKYNNKKIDNKLVRIIPIEFIMPNQKTVFHRLLNKKNNKNNYYWAKMMIKKNLALNRTNNVKHSAKIYGNRSNRMKQGLDWLMHNKRFEALRYEEYEDTDSPTDDFGMQEENGLNKILSID